MNATSASPAEHLPAGSAALPSGSAGPGRRSIDAPTRAFHWLTVLCFVGAYASADGERWRLLHVTLGYSLVGLLAFRLVWGLAGPRQVRFAGWAARLRGLPDALRQLRHDHWPGTLLQNLGLLLLIVLLLAALAATLASGWVTDQEFTGDWMAEVHEFFGNTALLLVLGHVGAVLGLSLLRQRNLVRPMWTGRSPGRGPDLVQHNRRWLALLLAAGVLGFWAWQWQTAPAGGLAAATAEQGQAADIDDDDD